MRFLVCAFFVVVACGPSEQVPPPKMDPPPVSGPTYAQDVAPILSKSCAGCHVEGGIAPFALGSYAQAQPMAAAMAADVQSKKMPPWMPGGDTPALQHDRRLSDDEISTLAQWAENGAPEGDTAHPAQLPPPEVIPFENPDLTFDTGYDYVPDATLTDDYRCFLVPLQVPVSRMATAYRVTPGNGKVVHHAIITLFDASQLPALQQLDDSQAGPGWQCFGGPVPSDSGITASGALGAWVPGVSVVQYTQGTANRLAVNAVAVIQVHYNLLGGDDPDRTKVEVKFAAVADEPSLQQIAGVPLVKRNLSIPPGAMGHVETRGLAANVWTQGRFYPDGDGFLVGVAGHMHLKGTRIQLQRTDASNTTTTLLDIPAWDFHWQGQYQLVTPIRIVPTDTLTISCTYDNPTAATVTWGEGTADEMCLASLQMVDQDPTATP